MGTLIVADLIGAKSCILVKDEDGLYTDNPKKNKNAEFIPEISTGELIGETWTILSLRGLAWRSSRTARSSTASRS